MLRELPPTSGLPLSWTDFLPYDGKTFESQLAAFLGVTAVQVECSGSASLVLALEALKTLSPRKTVIVPAYTCPVLARVVAQAGLTMSLCDTRPDSFDLDASMLESLVNNDTLCVIATHLAGLACDLEPILSICRQRGAWVIEDAAQALGALWNGQPVGTIGDVGVFSLSRGKGLTLYEGGVLVTRDSELRQALKTTSERFVASNPLLELTRVIQLVGYKLLYNPVGLHPVYGEPMRYWLKRGDHVRAVEDNFSETVPLHRVGEFRKTVGLSALRRLPSFLTANREQGISRAAELNKIPGVRVLGERVDTVGTWPFLVALFDCQKTRDLALNHLWCRGLGVTRFFVHDLADYEYLEKIVPRTPMPNARSLASRILTISNSSWVLDDDFARIREVIQSAASAAAVLRI